MKVIISMKKLFKIFCFALFFIINLTSAFTQYIQVRYYPGMFAYKPQTILIMPLINRTAATINESRVASLHSILLNERGYYAIPANLIQQSIRIDSMECLPDINSAPCHEFKDRFGIDALLYISVKVWDKNYSESFVHEEFEYSLISTINGKEIWYYDILMKTYTEVPRDVTEKSYPFWINTGCGIFTTIIASSIVTKFSSYNKTAEEAFKTAFLNLPAGKYNEHFLIDSLDKVNVKPDWKFQKFGNRIAFE